ncbi:hypothetical protein DFH07DRAFT_772276 [Mycena maculata]|uniref:Uncharacterized protein n=1 Tax=Mycena maculata TaxID=230809 RepID=A0AAD7NFK3_9AGAR|nr:hypothetical protein DFH07DRAFT_772276 [Mycena maculata]
MTTYPSVASGTDHSVAGAAASSDNARTAAALKFFNALNALSQAAPGSQAQRDALINDATAAAILAAQGAADQHGATVSPAPNTQGFHTSGPWVAGNLYVVIPTAPLLPIPEDPIPDDQEAPLWYAITRGRYIGVTLNNGLAINAVVGVRANNMKSYKTQALAISAFNEALHYRSAAVISV